MQPDDRKAGRVQAIDAFRGLAVLLMASANYLAGVAWIPAYLKHAPDIGYTVIDVIAPMFIMAVGFTAGVSARRRREAHGAAAALGGMAARYLAILGIGAVITAGEALVMPGEARIPNWGVLQAIGASGLLLLTVIYAKPIVRAAAGILLLAAYQWLLDTYFLNTVLSSSHNGLVGSLAWAGMLMLATAVADGFFASGGKRRRALSVLLPGAAALACGLILSIWFPISKNRASVSYMLVNLGICLLVFLAFFLLTEMKLKLKALRAVGKNPLAMYLLHLLLLGIVALPGAAWWYAEAPGWLVGAQLIALIGALTAAAIILDKRRVLLKL